MEYKTLASEVLVSLCNRNNVKSLVHCAICLRFKLCDNYRAAATVLKKNPDLITVVESSRQFQVVLGNHVAEVYHAIKQVADFDHSAVRSDGADDKKQNLFSRFIDVVSSIFIPLLIEMAALGVLKEFLALSQT